MSEPLIPTAVYTSPDIKEGKVFNPGEGPHTTHGRTTQISDVVINAGGEDRDKPSEAKDTPLGHLRSRLTTLQDQLNIFLTERMQNDKDKSARAEELERKIMDEGVDEESGD